MCILLLLLLPHQAYKDNENFNKERFATKLEFTVHHYAGRVIYNTGGFVEKNKDQLQVWSSVVPDFE